MVYRMSLHGVYEMRIRKEKRRNKKRRDKKKLFWLKNGTCEKRNSKKNSLNELPKFLVMYAHLLSIMSTMSF